MNILEAIEKVVDTLKKYSDSRYVKYDEMNAETDYKTPQEYGAGGKGFTDDTNAINQAIEENDVVYLPSGIYNISSPIVVATEGKRIYGTNGTKIITKNCDGFIVNNSNNINISDLEILGDGSAHHGVVINGTGYKNRFANLTITKFGGDGFHTNWFGGGFGVTTIEGCVFRNCANGIFCLSDALDQRNNITISNNIFGQITNSAIRITGHGINIENNNIEGCQYGIRVDNWDEVLKRESVAFCGSAVINITGNYLENATRAFFSFATNFRQASESTTRVSGFVDSIRIKGNYAFLNKSLSISEQFTFLEFITYLLEPDEPEQRTIEDITYSGNVFRTDYPSLVLINGSNLLTKSCNFTFSKLTHGECINMGEAIIVRNPGIVSE